MYYPYGRLSLTHLPSIWYIVFLVSIALLLCGCNFLQEIMQGVQLKDSMLKNPKSFVGKYFEVEIDNGIIGAAKPETILALRNSAKEMGKDLDDIKDAFDPKLQDMIQRQYLDTGLIVELNQGSNSADEKAKLLFQIEDFKKEKEDILFKVTILNKKYLGTPWWITGTNICTDAKLIDSPYFHR